MGRLNLSVFLLFFISVVGLGNSGGGSTLSEKDYRIAQAKADVQYYEARVKTTEVILKKSITKLRLDDRNLARMRKLAPSKSISQEELDFYEHERDQSAHNVALLQSRLDAARAELKGAEARVGIAQTMTFPPTFNFNLRSASGRKGEVIDCDLGELLEWEVLNFQGTRRSEKP